MQTIDRKPIKENLGFVSRQELDSIAKDVATEMELSSNDFERLTERKYSLLAIIGDGQTRNAALVDYSHGDVKRFLVMKVPKREVDRDLANYKSESKDTATCLRIIGCPEGLISKICGQEGEK